MKNEHAAFIHDSADVQTDDIGEGTRIWQFVVVLSGAKIGEYCNINAHCLLEGDTVIGDNTTLKSGVYVWNGLRIGSNVFVGPNVTFVNDQRPKNKRYITHPLTIIEDDVSIGANSCIGAGLTVGKGAMTGMGAVVTKDVPPYALVFGNPAAIRGWVDENGEPMTLLGNGKFQKSDGAIVTLDEQNNLISFDGI
jgi:acetyltransferase-like isoleucine patch superfamily enzyme